MKKETFYRSVEFKDKIQSEYDSVLRKWIKPNEIFYIDTGYGKTFVIASGNRNDPPLILLHGSGSNSYMWLNDAEIYSKKFRVFAVDIPGDPGKSEEYRTSWQNDDYSNWLKEIYKELGIDSAYIAGISIGGWIATKFSLTYPEMVRKLVLLCPSGFAKPKISFIFKALFLMLLGDYGLKKFEEILFNSKSIHPEASAYFRLVAKGFRSRTGAPPIFTDEQIRKLTMPLLFIGGGKDILINIPESEKRITELLTHARVEILPQAGHAITGTVDIVERFLSNS